jgi:hypothetical protein
VDWARGLVRGWALAALAVIHTLLPRRMVSHQAEERTPRADDREVTLACHERPPPFAAWYHTG